MDERAKEDPPMLQNEITLQKVDPLTANGTLSWQLSLQFDSGRKPSNCVT